MQDHKLSLSRTIGANPSSPPVAPETSRPRTNPNYLQLRWLNVTLGKPVRLGLMSGEEIEGRLMGFDQYTLMVELPGQPILLVWKHAVAYVQPRP